MTRPLHEIAFDILHAWEKPALGALPYLRVMEQLDRIDDHYYHDTARDIVLRFLVNATQWRGDVARGVKAELRAMLGES